jgi:hypothetical protein
VPFWTLNNRSLGEFLELLLTQGSVVAPNAAAGETLHFVNPTVDPSIVSVQLTAFAMVQPSTATTLLTYQPAVTSTKIGATVPYNQFNYIDGKGFEVKFEFNLNTFTIQRYAVSFFRFHSLCFVIFSIVPEIYRFSYFKCVFAMVMHRQASK